MLNVCGHLEVKKLARAAKGFIDVKMTFNHDSLHQWNVILSKHLGFTSQNAVTVLASLTPNSHQTTQVCTGN